VGKNVLFERHENFRYKNLEEKLLG